MNDQCRTVSDALADGSSSFPAAWERFIDQWGDREGEFFVISCDRNTGVHGLAVTPGGGQATTALAPQLSYPDGTTRPAFYPGDLVRKQ